MTEPWVKIKRLTEKQQAHKNLKLVKDQEKGKKLEMVKLEGSPRAFKLVEIKNDLLCDISGDILPENDNPKSICKLDFNRNGCKYMTQNYGCSCENPCKYKIEPW